jgi:hypothetical protein
MGEEKVPSRTTLQIFRGIHLVNPSENSLYPERTGTKVDEQERRGANRDETWQIHTCRSRLVDLSLTEVVSRSRRPHPAFCSSILCELSSVFSFNLSLSLVLSPLRPPRATTQPTECPSHYAPTSPFRSGGARAENAVPMENNSPIQLGIGTTPAERSPNLCSARKRKSRDSLTHFLLHARLQGGNDGWKRQKTRLTRIYPSESPDRALYVHREITIYAPRLSDTDKNMHLGCSV